VHPRGLRVTLAGMTPPPPSPRSWSLAAVLPSVVAFALTLLPGLGTLDYHACLLLAPIVGLCAGHLALRDHARRAWLLLLLGPLAVLLLAALWVPDCNLLYGSAFYLLGPAVSALVGASWGHLARMLPVRNSLKTLAFYALVLASLVRPALHFYQHPQVFAFHGLVGWLAGALYEDAVAIHWSYLAFRLLDVALWGPLLVLPLQPSWRDRRVQALPALALTALVVGELRAGPEKWRVTTENLIAHVLPIRLDVPAHDGAPALVLHLPADPRLRPYRALVAEDSAFRVSQLQHWFGIAPPGPIELFLYPDAHAKRTWMGAEHVDMAKPWLRQVHMVLPEYGATVLTHELAHVYASAFGPAPFGVPMRHGLLPDAVLIEGVAVAAEWPIRAGLDSHQWARAMRELGLAPPLQSLMSPVGFFGQSSDRAYTLAGSFLRWLADTHGMAALQRVYRTADVTEATGESLDVLARAWGEYVDDGALHPLTGDDRERAKARFERPGLFQQPCALEVGRCEERAAALWRTGEDRKAAELWQSLVQRVQRASGEPPDPDLTGAWAASLVRIERGNEGLRLLDGLLALPEAATATVGPALNRLQRAQVRIERGDLLLQIGEVQGARQAWQRAAEQPLAEATLRTLEVKQRLANTAEGMAVVRQLLAAGGPPAHAEPLIDGLYAAAPEDPVAGYLWARLHLLRGDRPEAAAVLVQAERQAFGSQTSRVGAEIRRMLAVQAAREGDCATVAVLSGNARPLPWWTADVQARCEWMARRVPEKP
jgi:hypothetical protein